MSRARSSAGSAEPGLTGDEQFDAALLLSDLAEHHRLAASTQIRRQFIEASSLEVCA